MPTFEPYLEAVLAGDRGRALEAVRSQLAQGHAVPEVYAEVLQPAQYEIGRLWETGEITVGREHLATGITQYVISRLYDELEVNAAHRGRALLTGVTDELHQVGANMVADVLEADGWDMRFLGTHLPEADIVAEVAEHRPHLVGVSVTLERNLPTAQTLIRRIREECPGTSIMVGGGAFRGGSDRWREIGADATAGDVRAACGVAVRLLESG